jgi:hypothetical protein
LLRKKERNSKEKESLKKKYVPCLSAKRALIVEKKRNKFQRKRRREVCSMSFKGFNKHGHHMAVKRIK